MIEAVTLAEWLDLLGTVALTGGALFSAFVHRPAPLGRRLGHTAIGAVAVALLVELLLTTLRLSPLDPARGWSLMADVLTTRWGLLWIARAAGLCLLAACRLGSGLQVALLGPWLLARSFQGHAGAHGTLPACLDGLHLLAACTWIGGLAQFSLLSAADVAVAAPRFRRLAAAAVATVLPSGIYAALLHVPSLDALLDSAYGRVLTIKVVGVTLLCALGASNHVHRLRAGPIAWLVARWNPVRLEVAIGSLVLLLSALLGALPMPHPPPH